MCLNFEWIRLDAYWCIFPWIFFSTPNRKTERPTEIPKGREHSENVGVLWQLCVEQCQTWDMDCRYLDSNHPNIFLLDYARLWCYTWTTWSLQLTSILNWNDFPQISSLFDALSVSSILVMVRRNKHLSLLNLLCLIAEIISCCICLKNHNSQCAFP